MVLFNHIVPGAVTSDIEATLIDLTDPNLLYERWWCWCNFLSQIWQRREIWRLKKDDVKKIVASIGQRDRFFSYVYILVVKFTRVSYPVGPQLENQSVRVTKSLPVAQLFWSGTCLEPLKIFFVHPFPCNIGGRPQTPLHKLGVFPSGDDRVLGSHIG